MKKLNWQFKTLIFFILLWLVLNIENIFVKLVEIIVMSPLHINSFLNNVLGNEVWGNMVNIMSNPLLLLIMTISVSTLLIKIIQVIDDILN